MLFWIVLQSKPTFYGKGYRFPENFSLSWGIKEIHSKFEWE